MPKGKTVRYLETLLCGFLFGALFILAVGFEKEEQQVSMEEILKPGTFGDVRFVKGGLSSSPEGPEVLTIWKDKYLFIAIETDGSGKVNKCEVWDDTNRKLVDARFANGKLSELWVFTNDKLGSFGIKASDKPGVWHRARYFRSTKADKPIGEAYQDIDFDGQFDGKVVIDENTKVTSESIFIGGKWLEVAAHDINDLDAFALYINGKYYKIRLDDTESLKEAAALPKSAKKRVHYDFEYGKGWKERKE